MRFDSLRLRNIGPFKDVEIDFSKISGLLVAVVGANGAGKSTLLELLRGTIDRQCATRGTLASLATARDSMAEVTVVNGARYTVRQSVDAISAKGETLILDASGIPVLDGTKRSEGDRWVAEHFPPASVLYSSSIAVQGQRGFLDLSAADRKKMLVKLLGLERLERMAEGARERAREVKGTLEVLRGRLADVPVPELEALTTAKHVADALVSECVERLHAARVAFDRARAAAEDASRQAELLEQRRAAQARLKQATEALSILETRLKNNQELPQRAAEINGAVERGKALAQLIEAQREDVALARGRADVAASVVQSTQSAAIRAEKAFVGLRGRTAQISKRLEDRGRVLEAVELVEALTKRALEAAASVQECEAKTVELETIVVGGKDERIGKLRDGLSTIADPASDIEPRPFAEVVIHNDDVRALEAERAPTALRAMRDELTRRRRSLDALREQKADTGKLAGRAKDIRAAEAEMQAAEIDLACARAALDAANAETTAATQQSQETVAQLKTALASQQKLQADLDEISSLIALQPRLASAQARIEELSAQIPPAQEAVKLCETELASLPVVAIAAVNLDSFQMDVEGREIAERNARDTVTRAQQAIEQAERAVLQRDALQRDITEGESELADWTRLALDLGRDGLQCMELDASLPELNALANDLLRNCHGSRFTVELKTDRLSADGKNVLEGLDARVIDTEHGRDALAETYSGGECVIVGEALALALTMLACRRSGIEGPSLVRDESGAALDPANGRAYIAMLRRAAMQIGASKVIYVSHDAALQELADARIQITDGKVEVCA